MDSQALTRRLLEIAGMGCWLDGTECPYGKPQGQFLKRPLAFCKPNKPTSAGTNGCSKLNNHSDELDELMSEFLHGEIREELFEKVQKATTKVSSKLRALADEAESDQAKEVLKLAAELIGAEENGLEDGDVVLLEDLELD